ncbi:MAG: DUF3084 domain-containing protein [Synergistaceae bacterium]|nr:DUF3084 domain-containing protein [Synergistota bacterium]NLM71029.1 DUF3084 domain-containing protein [Synergistaceae bacterium]
MQIQIWSDMNWGLILALVVLSGVLAYLGDVLGMRLGKRRISLLGLRPRDTSRVITAITGALISIAILVTMTIISDNVRTALFSMKFLQGQLQTLTRDLQKSRDEAELAAMNLAGSETRLQEQQKMLSEVQSELESVSPMLDEARSELSLVRAEKERIEQEKSALSRSVEELKEEAEELRKGLVQMRSGRIAVFARETLSQAAIEPMSTRGETERIFQELRRRAALVVAARTGQSTSDIVLAVDLETESERIGECSDQPIRRFVRTIAEANAVLGEDIRVVYEVRDSVLVYRKGELLLSRIIQPYEGINAETELHLILRMVNRRAVADEIKPDPVTGDVGTLDGAQFFEAVDQLSKADGPMRIDITAAEDIHTEGPVRVAIRLSPAGGTNEPLEE